MGTPEITDKYSADMDIMVTRKERQKESKHNLMDLGERLDVEPKECRTIAGSFHPWHVQTPWR